MVKDDQENEQGRPRQPRPAGRRFEARGLAFRLAALALVTGSLSATGFLMLRWLQTPEPAGAGAPPAAAPGKPPSSLFSQWPGKGERRPDFVVLLSGDGDGYIQPCGCSKPQKGGLERRYNLLRSLRDRGWKVVAGDLGNLAQKPSPQALLKYRYSMEALHRLNYTAVGVGLNEMELPLLEALAQYSLDNPSPRVLACNLAGKETNFPEMVASYKMADGVSPRVGFVGLVAASVQSAAQKLDHSLRFDSAEKSLSALLADMAPREKPELLVLLFQGSQKEARACAARFPQFRVIVCLEEDEEPSGQAERVGNTLIIGLGHKGRYVGLVGAFHNERGSPAYDLYYQLVSMGPEYETPEGKDADNPILGLLEDYTREVKRGNYLSHYPQTPHPMQRVFKNATYVGSERCKHCHEYAYKVWKESPHSHAYETLVNAKRPSLRQYDGECVACHVTGFGYQGGFSDEEKTAKLKDNGCENCHGPGSLHVKGDKTPQMLEAMNPYKTQPNETPAQKAERLNRLDASCQKCHDIDNDVHWKLDKWQKIVHMTPPDEK